MRYFLLVMVIAMLTGCAMKDPYQQGAFEPSDLYNERMSARLTSSQAQLNDMYVKCIRDHYGNPDEIKKFCEPILAPLRLKADIGSLT